MTRATKIVFILLSFVVYFSKYMKDKVKIYDKIDKNYKSLLFLLFIKVRTLSTKTYYFKETLNIYFTLQTT